MRLVTRHLYAIQVFLFFLLASLTLPSTILRNQSNVNSIHSQSNDWISEDNFCNELKSKNILHCKCLILESNLLSLECNGSLGVKQIQTTLTLLSENYSNKFQLDLLIFRNIANENVNSRKSFLLPNIQVNTLRIENSPNLVSLDTNEKIPDNLQTSLRRIDMSNVGVNQGVFDFFRKFSNLHTVQLENLQLGPILNSTAFQSSPCFPSLRRLSLNSGCSPLKEPITTIEPKVFFSLCNLELLDLSCLNLTTISAGGLLLQNRTSSKPNRWIIDLSRNQLTSMTDFLQDLVDTQRRSERFLQQIELKLDYNPIEILHKASFEQFFENGNKLSIWQGLRNSKLNCDVCENSWLLSTPGLPLESYCCPKNSKEGPILYRLSELAPNHFDHCNNNY